MSGNYRCIRDTLVPLLSREHKLSHADTALVHCIFINIPPNCSKLQQSIGQVYRLSQSQEAQVHYYDTWIYCVTPAWRRPCGHSSYWSHMLAYGNGGFGRRDDTEMVVPAEEMIQKWEDQLGPLKDLRADLYGPGGKFEGMRKITT